MILSKYITKARVKLAISFLILATIIGVSILPSSDNLDGLSLTTYAHNPEHTDTSSTIDADTNLANLSIMIESVDVEQTSSEASIARVNFLVNDQSQQDGFVYSSEIPLSRELQEFTYNRCLEEEISYPVVLSVMWKESSFNPHAVGYNSNGTSDSGIMQINSSNHQRLKHELGLTNLMDAKQNITAGTSMLGDLIQEHGEYFGVMAYKSGEYGMLDEKAAGDYSSPYANTVLSKSKDFESLLADRKSVV